MNGRRAASLADVARLAGVSMSTASKAINDRFDVNAETKLRVLDAAARLDFFPNALARGLMEGRSYTVGIVTNDSAGRFVPSIMTGAQRALETNGGDVGVLLMETRGEAEVEERSIRFLLERRVDGLIVVDDVMRPRSPVTVTGGLPTVYAFAASASRGDCSVIPDLRQGARLATEHLIGLGRRSIVHLGGPGGDPSSHERADGTRDALVSADLPSEDFRFRFGDWLEQFGWDAMGALLADGPAMDGVVAGNDQIARGALERLAVAGVAVPESVAVVGNDNWEVLTRFGRHPISSIDLRLDEIGAEAIRLLYSGDSPPAGTTRVAGHLVIRSSTVRAAGSGPVGPIVHQ